MGDQKAEQPASLDVRKDIMANIGQSVFRDFNVAFALMSLIPLCIGIYVLAAKLFTLSILEGTTGVYFLIAIVIALLGFLVGRRILQAVLGRLIEASVTLRQHEVMKSAFIANVAYELRPPLSAVQMSLKNMSDGLLGPMTDPQHRTVQECHGIVGRLARMATELIDVTGFGSGKPRLQQDVFELQQAVHEALRANDPYLKAHRLTVSLKLPEQPALFFGDRPKFLQALGSLIDHAVRWSTEGSTITIELSSLLEGWRLVVSHDIAGSKSDFARALDTFVRLGGKVEQNLGLGLRLATEIAELHYGRFWVEGEPGRDSQLILSLPALEPPSERPAQPADQRRAQPLVR